jgi:hypothetical protein
LPSLAPPARRAPVGHLDAITVAGLVPPGTDDTVAPVVVDLGRADDLSRDGLELLAALAHRGRVRVVGARWPQVVGALLDAPLGEVGRLGALARRLIDGRA